MPDFIVPGEDDFSVFKETLSPEGDGSHNGLTDLYSEWREELEKAFTENRLFEATWTSKKEIRTGRIVRRPEYIVVEATQFCDEDEDLITDAMWEMCKPDNDLYEKLAQNYELIEKIAEACSEYGMPELGDTGYTSSIKLPADADLEYCIDELGTAENEADVKCQENFERLVDVIKWTTMDPTIEK